MLGRVEAKMIKLDAESCKIGLSREGKPLLGAGYASAGGPITAPGTDVLESMAVFWIVRIWKNHNFECQGKTRGNLLSFLKWENLNFQEEEDGVS